MVIYVCLTVFCAVFILLWKKLHLKDELRIYFVLGASIGILGAASVINNSGVKLETDDSGNAMLERNKPGHGAYTKKLVLELEGAQQEYSVRVEEEHLSESEVNEAFVSTIEMIDSSFFHGNDSRDAVSGSVNLSKKNNVEVSSERKPGVKEKAEVTVEYSFQPSGVVASDGTLRDDKIGEEGTLVQATVLLSCDGRHAEHFFSFMAYKKTVEEADDIVAKLGDEIEELNKGEGEYLSLPSEVMNYPVKWSLPESGGEYNILLFGIFAAVGLCVAKREDKKKKKRERMAELERGYPMMVSALSLLIGAGMTVGAAWDRIVSAYLKRVEKGMGKEAVYEEMLLTSRQIRDGKSEKDSLTGFAERINIGIYRKLISMILQNLRKGGRDLDIMLEREVENAYVMLRNQAKTKGAEASTKMLLPMMLSLLVVIVVIIVPAIYTMDV